MRNLIALMLITILFYSCKNTGQKENNTNVPSEINTDSTKLEQQQVSKDKTISQRPVDINIVLDSMILETVDGLTIIDNKWKSDTVYKFDTTDKVTTIRYMPDSSIIALTYNRDRVPNFMFYEIDLNGMVLHQSSIEGEYYNIADINNFIPIDEYIYYQIEIGKDIYCYNNKTKEHSYAEDAYLLNLDFKKYNEATGDNTFTSNTGDYSVYIDFFNLKLLDHKNNHTYEFISSDNNMPQNDWCFGVGVWNASGDKFYFDNSGQVACIWELDVKNFTLDKVVPEHEAEIPIIIGEVIYYCENNLIKKTEFVEIGNVIKENTGIEKVTKIESAQTVD